MNLRNLPSNQAAGKPASKSRQSNSKPGRGWIAVNVAAWRVAEMKKLARASGMPFRLFCEFALITAANNLRDKLGLKYLQASHLSGRQIRALAEKHQLCCRATVAPHPEHN
jgi:hypothetical protein